MLAGAVLVVALAWAGVTALLARGALEDAQGHLDAARAAAVRQDFAVASEQVRAAAGPAHRARRLTSGPLWALGGRLPLTGPTVRAVTVSARQVDVLATRVLPEVLQAAQEAAPDRLRSSVDTIDLAPLAAAAAPLADADSALAQVRAALSGQGRGVVGPVRRGLTGLQGSVADLAASVHAAALAARLLPPMLGSAGPREYLLAFQNPAEARGTGGLVGGYGVLDTDHGRLSVQSLGTDADLTGLPSVPASLGADYTALWGSDPALWVNSNESANFPFGAEIWLDAWQRQHGRRLDGVVALDPEVLSALLGVTGPARLPDGEQISADTVVRQTMQTAYVRFAADPAARKTYLTTVSAAVVRRLLGTTGDTSAMLRALGWAAGQRRLLVYSSHPDEERALAGQPIAGTLPDGPGPSALVAVNNAAGNKLDYYLDRRISYRGSVCRSGGMRPTRIELDLTNTVAPDASLPDYVVGVLGAHAATAAERNDDKVTAGFWLSPDALVQQVLVDGHAAAFGLGREAGHPVVLTTLTLQPRVTHTVVVSMLEPATSATARLVVQPLVRPATPSVSVPTCS